jgi:predicted DCC family thiol-disulfide oxidoreductase YuxK
VKSTQGSASADAAAVGNARMHLPMPDERPEADVVIYDGDCRICTRQIENLARWDTRRRLAFLSLHDPRVAQHYPDLTREKLLEQMAVVDPHGVRYWGAAAVRRLTRLVPRLWWLAPLLHLPGTLPVWQRLYRQFARRRYLFGKTDACQDGCRIHSRD